MRANIALAISRARADCCNFACRDLNVATSRSVFAGPYITSKEEEEKFGTAFLHMTEGFLALPICIPGTAVWKAKTGRLYILGVLEKAAAKSKAAMKVGCSLSTLFASSDAAKRI